MESSIFDMKARRQLLSAVGITVVLTATFMAGCSPKADTTSGGGSGSGSTGPAPIAKPGAQIGANNPPPGQPNHMSPEMQAQLQHYQSMGNGGGNAAPASPK